MVYGVLGKLLWQGRLKDTEVVIIHRGAPDDKKDISGDRVTAVKGSHFVYRNREGTKTTIPLHRVLEVRLDGKTIWKRAGKA